MTIETKFQPGDTVFFMHKNAVRSSRVKSLSVFTSTTDPIRVMISALDPDRYEHDLVCIEPMSERFFFASKEELIASL